MLQKLAQISTINSIYFIVAASHVALRLLHQTLHHICESKSNLHMPRLIFFAVYFAKVLQIFATLCESAAFILFYLTCVDVFKQNKNPTFLLVKSCF